jgi:hypothetical protein
MATALACSAVSNALGRVLVQPMSSNVTKMKDAVFIKPRSRRPELSHAGRAMSTANAELRRPTSFGSSAMLENIPSETQTKLPACFWENSHAALRLSNMQAEPSKRNKSATPLSPLTAVIIAPIHSKPPPIPQTIVKYGFGNDHNNILDNRFMLSYLSFL